MDKVKRLQQFVSTRSGQKIRVTHVTRSETNPKDDMCTVCDVKPLGVVDKATQRVIKADTIRRHYVKFVP